uniref:Uncharacterized protein n=1 Tax=Rhizophora mucronata TaxID=61149 RepID=A0A2P2JK43_RHIMU
MGLGFGRHERSRVQAGERVAVQHESSF